MADAPATNSKAQFKRPSGQHRLVSVPDGRGQIFTLGMLSAHLAMIGRLACAGNQGTDVRGGIRENRIDSKFGIEGDPPMHLLHDWNVQSAET